MLSGHRPSIVLVGDDAPAVEDATDAIRLKAKSLRSQIGPHLPAVRRDAQTPNPDLKTRIRRALRNQPRDATEPAAFSISTDTRTATFAGAPFPLDYDPELASSDAQLMVEYFAGFEGFAGTPDEVRELQEEYFDGGVGVARLAVARDVAGGVVAVQVGERRGRGAAVGPVAHQRRGFGMGSTSEAERDD